MKYILRKLKKERRKNEAETALIVGIFLMLAYSAFLIPVLIKLFK